MDSMYSANFRKQAREKLAGKWGKAVLITLAFISISIVLSFIEQRLPKSLMLIFSIVELIIEIPLSYGLIVSFLKLYNGEEVSAYDFTSSAIANFSRAWGVFFRTLLKLLLPICLLIVSIVLIGMGVGFASASQLLSTDSAQTLSSVAGSFSFIALLGVIGYIASIIWLIIKSYSLQLAQYIAIENESMSCADAVQKSQDLMIGKKVVYVKNL